MTLPVQNQTVSEKRLRVNTPKPGSTSKPAKPAFVPASEEEWIALSGGDILPKKSRSVRAAEDHATRL